jgi:tRNA (cmo5U34)-methyltransferase
MNFFDNHKQFIDCDPRKDRGMPQVNCETMSKRCKATLPTWLIEGKSILDLGSCFGAYGHYALLHGAKHYTGVELQKQFVDKSIELLAQHHTNFTIKQQDALEFVRESTDQYDIVIASGLIHGYTDVIELIKHISRIAKEHIIIESIDIDEKIYPKIEFKPYRMVIPKLNDQGNYRYSEGLTPIIGLKAVSFILNECGFTMDGGRIKPEAITSSVDVYNNPLEDLDPSYITANRYIARFIKAEQTNKISLQHNTSKNNAKLLPKMWEFNNDVAKRFQFEARTNIPDYDRVIDTCLNIANKKFDKTISIIDIGSALGHTLDVFFKDGFENIIGVDNSTEMINNSLHQHKVKYSTKLPTGNYDMVLANWTLHFVNERKEYIQDVYDNMNNGGVFILSDKTPQDDFIKEMYYDFKRSNGITDEYIYEKEEKLKGYMNLMPIRWYLDTMKLTGFRNIQIINSRFGFVTFYCEK